MKPVRDRKAKVIFQLLSDGLFPRPRKLFLNWNASCLPKAVTPNSDGCAQNPFFFFFFLPCVMWQRAELSASYDLVQTGHELLWIREEAKCQAGAGERLCVYYIRYECSLMRLWKRMIKAVNLDTQTVTTWEGWPRDANGYFQSTVPKVHIQTAPQINNHFEESWGACSHSILDGMDTFTCSRDTYSSVLCRVLL